MVYRTIEDFLAHWKEESEGAAKIYAALTDASLSQPVAEGHRTLGKIAWHVVTSIPEMMSKTGLPVTSAEEDGPMPATAAEIAAAYTAVAAELGAVLGERWTDADLEVEDEMYGMSWRRAYTIKALVEHQIHHVGQMTVLMRQAGLTVPGIYGPSQEEWAQLGMEPPPL
jgi:uncharacterized damage-inducible protein DinB